jgi:hypothetical protein
MEFSSPIWDSSKSLYKIVIKTRLSVDSEPQYVDLSGEIFSIEMPDTESEAMQRLVKEFVQHLIAKDTEAKWFATRLKESSILKRLTHKWIPSELTPPSEWAVARWHPIGLEVTTQHFTLLWEVKDFQISAPQISSRFLSLSRPESPNAAPNAAPNATPNASPNTDQIAIPVASSDKEVVRQIILQPSLLSERSNANTDIPFIDIEEQLRDKEHLHEARLRLALAKLKANRLANMYYQKYGEVCTDEEYDESD